MIRKLRPRVPLVVMLTVAFGYFLVGISALAVAPRGDVGDRAVGAVVLVLACVVGGTAVTNIVVLSSDAITFRYFFRRKVIAWETVRSFRVVPMGRGFFSSMKADLAPSGSVRVSSIVGTKRYVRNVIAEFEEFRRQAVDPR